jgi:hypothetical protein
LLVEVSDRAPYDLSEVVPSWLRWVVLARDVALVVEVGPELGR